MVEKSNKIKAVIFDWDGTLNNSNRAIYKSYAECLRRLKLPKLSLLKFRKIYESDYRKFEVKMGITLDKRELSDKIWMKTYRKQKSNLLPGVEKFLKKIKKKYLLGLVTGGSSERVKEELHKYGLNNIFDVVITSDDIRKKKPNPESLKICAKKMNVRAGNCVYIGDMDGDILAAKKAGMISVAVDWGYLHGSFLKKFKPDHIVKSLDELYAIIIGK